MKFKPIFISFFIFCCIGNCFSQETARERLQRRNQGQSHTNSTVELTSRATQMNRTQSTDIGEVKWLREIYRYLDLSKEGNAPLYYPVLPEQGRMNLFTLIFNLLSENKIAAYEYLDGREIFTDEYKIDFKEFLDRFGIFHETQNGNIVVSEVDIPSHEVLGYYLKEAYYFETGTSKYGVKTVAVCPIIYRQADYESQTVRYPLFWIVYDELRPYTLRMPIMTSSLNNTMTGTIDDFFRMKHYDGDIYKATNPRNLAISQYTSTPEEMKAEQERVEQQLRDFEERLWKGDTDTTRVLPYRQKQRAGGSTTMRNRRY